MILTEIINAHVDSQFFIVSPWIRNILFRTSVRGDLRLALSHTPSRISLLKLLEEFLRRGGRLTLVCLPPHRLIYQGDIDSLVQLFRLREIVENPNLKLTLSSQINKATSSILVNKPMIDFLATLKKKYGERVEIIFNERLHAKIYLGEQIAMVGSANITNSGFQYNDEVCVVGCNDEFTSDLKGFVTSIIDRGFSAKCEDYFLYRHLNLPPDMLRKLHPDVEKLYNTVLNYLSSKERRELDFSSYHYTEKQ